MNIEIVTKTEQPLFSRTEIIGKLFFSGPTPSRKAVVDEIAKQMKADAKLVAVRKIQMEYGHEFANIEAVLYKKEADLNKIESGYVIKRHEEKKKEEKAAPTPAPAETPKEDEAPADDTKKTDAPAEEAPVEEAATEVSETTVSDGAQKPEQVSDMKKEGDN